jgi:hypothetical protein
LLTEYDLTVDAILKGPAEVRFEDTAFFEDRFPEYEEARRLLDVKPTHFSIDFSAVKDAVADFEMARDSFEDSQAQNNELRERIRPGQILVPITLEKRAKEYSIGLNMPFEWEDKPSAFETGLYDYLGEQLHESMGNSFSLIRRVQYPIRGKRGIARYELVIPREETGLHQNILQVTGALQRVNPQVCYGKVALVMVYLDQLNESNKVALPAPSMDEFEPPYPNLYHHLKEQHGAEYASAHIQKDVYTIADVSDILDVGMNRVYTLLSKERLKEMPGMDQKVVTKDSLDSFLGTHERTSRGWMPVDND